jgi:hypothetical protein
MTDTFKQIIEDTFIPYAKRYFDQVYLEREKLRVDGVAVFGEGNVMLAGVCLRVFSFLVLQMDKESAEYRDYLEKLKAIVGFTADMEQVTWSRYFYLHGLDMLREDGILAEVVPADILAKLQEKLEWRDIVREEDISLINLPTNYYGVAFIIAKYREMLGWEDVGGSDRILKKLMEHHQKYSSRADYMDETDGEGRFDIYSLDTPSEMCNRLVNTHSEVPEMFKVALRNSCDIFLQLANNEGKGFAYGRSIGAHGDAAVAEVLTIAAKLGLLTREEQDLAYGYIVKVAERHVRFWMEPEMDDAVNMWEKGRAVDLYRDKARILEVSLDICLKYLMAYDDWKKLGYEDRPVPENYQNMLNQLPWHRYFQFVAENDMERGLAVIRQQGYVFSLPLINGGARYYWEAPYLPVPHETALLETSANTNPAHLVPRLTLEDGSQIMPISYIQKITEEESGAEYTISYSQEVLCLIGAKGPRPYPGLSSRTIYKFRPGSIEREDIFDNPGGLKIKEYSMVFGTFSGDAVADGNNVRFKKGGVYEMQAFGYEKCELTRVEGSEAREYKTPYGPFQTWLVWKNEGITQDKRFRVKWVLKYR